MLKILQVRLQQYVNRELSDVQAGFRKSRGTRDQIASLHWIIKKARKYQKNTCLLDYAKAFDCVDHNKLENFSRWCWRRLWRVLWITRRLNQSILKEISPEHSLEGLVLKLQNFGHLMRRADSFEKTLMLGKIESGRRRG